MKSNNPNNNQQHTHTRGKRKHAILRRGVSSGPMNLSRGDSLGRFLKTAIFLIRYLHYGMWINSVPKLRENKSKPRKHKKSKWISVGENPSGAQQCRFGDRYGTLSLSKRLPKNGTNFLKQNPFEITRTFRGKPLRNQELRSPFTTSF